MKTVEAPKSVTTVEALQDVQYHAVSSAGIAYNETKTCWAQDWVQQQMGGCVQVGFYVEGEGLYVYCKLYCKFDTKYHQKQSKVWNKEGCTTVCNEKLNMRHPLYTGKH